ncbi:histidinol dehydrogenase [Pantoea sp. Mhis]|uniref:histidinol dehydrogenase n=1 Tax=Pantoea sp. Mhis TaxID=2576759 RepID=UPI00135A50B9|nr:histidinol dehydrogenase [Pantoea sp. Mhis]MXP56164.1 histidinol dehydrogenase [Pantoea sp. Mhis]
MDTILTPIHWQSCNKKDKYNLLQRPVRLNSEDISNIVYDIIMQVKELGDNALHKFNMQFDEIKVKNLRVTSEEITKASCRSSNMLKKAINMAIDNIKTFHNAQKINMVDIETQPGVRCQQITRAIKSVGLYIPGGKASLFSSVLMLAIPANIAGCERIILCSPPPIRDEILYAAHLCNVKEIFRVGGAQAIAALAFGTKTIPKVNKIFGPGNIYVTEAKRQVNQYYSGPAIDMPAGPSEILVIADENANPKFIASDLLAQAEHGLDSQAILLTPSEQLAQHVATETKIQLLEFSKSDTIRQALINSRLIIVQDLQQCIEISNYYGPEHLMIQTQEPRKLLNYINNAGSIFLGDWSPESAGDYASGTNHVLPTHGYTTTYSSLGLIDFQKRITIQELTPEGLLNLSESIKCLAAAEQLEAHRNSITLRVVALKGKI